MIETSLMYSMSNGAKCKVCKKLFPAIYFLTRCDDCIDDSAQFRECCYSCLEAEIEYHIECHKSIEIV